MACLASCRRQHAVRSALRALMQEQRASIDCLLCVLCVLCHARRLPMLDASVKAREDAAAFDTSRLVEFSERLLWEGPVLALSPLVREPGRLAITDSRVYFQPLHNISGVLRWLCAHSGMLPF